MPEPLLDFLACPRCDQALNDSHDGLLRCAACQVDFPRVAGIPWLFAEPEASCGEWRNRLHFALQKIVHDIERVDAETGNPDLAAVTGRRLTRYRECLQAHSDQLSTLLEPLEPGAGTASYESYLALRTRLPADQGLNTYYANIHRDWAWGEEENNASLDQVRAVAKDGTSFGSVLVLGAGAGRLAYDIHMQLDCERTLAFDFNPMLLLIAKAMTDGDTLPMYEFPIAPRTLEDDAVLRELTAPEPVRDGFHLILGDALRAPFRQRAFDTVVTPWLIDIVTEDLPVFARRINRLLKPGGQWINFGSLAFHHPRRAMQYSPDEVRAIVRGAGFSNPFVTEATIPYMCSPASRHGRQEEVFSFGAIKEEQASAPPRHKALPDWLVTGRDPVPLLQSFRTQAMTTQIYAFIMSLIDGKRSIEDMADLFAKQNLMGRDEAMPAIRNFLTTMFDDANQQSHF
jgi:SAM-dependent methyltransferase/uncharacterized protein YbaR (Trm112 family)